MSEYLKTYSLSLKTVSPLFIGDGKSLSKKEYIYLPDQKKVLVPDPGKMYEGILKKGLSRQFTDYLLNANDKRGLEHWLLSCRLSRADYVKWIRYSLEGGDHLGEGNRPVEIATFIKDGYGIPYVPGTSIKGMLRSLLLTYVLCDLVEKPDFVQKNPALVQEIKEIKTKVAAANQTQKYAKKDYLKNEADQLETAVFHTLGRQDQHGKALRREDAVNDVMSGLIVSDSQPLDWKNMILCQKIDRPLTGDDNKINILREAVRPGTVINFSLTIDTTVCPYTMEDIQKAAEVFNDLYYRYYLQYFNVDRPADDSVWLGGGAGFFTKTVLYPLMGREEGLKAAKAVFEHTLGRINEKHKHYKDTTVSPHMLKCTEYKGDDNHQMGQCRLMLKSGGKV